ncbi:hypothetical protein FQZ97_665380 [compost metagenome]
MADQLLTALYETKRQNFLIGFIQNPERFDSALAFAYYRRLAPVFHEDVIREIYESDPFADVYWVKAEFINEVLDHLDELDREGKYDELKFSNLEDKFGGYKANRMELRYIIEYARINNRFSDEMYDAISEMAPVEAKNYAKTFTPEDVNFY